MRYITRLGQDIRQLQHEQAKDYDCFFCVIKTRTAIACPAIALQCTLCDEIHFCYMLQMFVMDRFANILFTPSVSIHLYPQGSVESLRSQDIGSWWKGQHTQTSWNLNFAYGLPLQERNLLVPLISLAPSFGIQISLGRTVQKFVLNFFFYSIASYTSILSPPLFPDIQSTLLHRIKTWPNVPFSASS